MSKEPVQNKTNALKGALDPGATPPAEETKAPIAKHILNAYEENKKIIRQSCLKAAIEYTKGKREATGMDTTTGYVIFKEPSVEDVLSVSEKFEAWVNR